MEEFYQDFQIISREEAKEIIDILSFGNDNSFYTSKDIKLFAYNIPEDYLLIPLKRNEKLYGFVGLSMPSSYDLQDTILSILYHLTISLENSFIYEHTEKLSCIDPLTGVYNKRKIDEILENEINRALRYNRPLSLLFIDIDHFKNINDMYGHIIGDNFLKELALFLLRNTRNIDSIGRFGGEEFVCILPETDLDSAYKVGEKLRIRWNIERHIVPINVQEKTGTLSIGIANSPIHSQNPRELLILADNALYKAKRERNKTSIFEKF
ncbi:MULTISPECIES: GGDEF domain-containing protein [Dictyoglomus]|uniref:diguanylate cyclase n=1 Tax=Dictyoglomus turgidum (strain DSM 6724 / Z-1310) TaxID=515635 RepID=B8E0L1_DICTD|nr:MULTISPECIES: GGDEF domain-containing protein [Dictyoglomus]ACK43031.1 diguanylate cyclase [Dictyoglomus turgidum DSM 6724]HBU31092.1 GGDEF domain-containing protein [Dictyoglomus sp.]